MSKTRSKVMTIANSLVTEEDLTDIKILKGTESITKPGIKESAGILVSKDKLTKIEKRVSLPDVIEAPVEKGQKIGEIEFFVDNEKVGSTDIVAAKDIKKINPLQMFARIADKMMYG